VGLVFGLIYGLGLVLASWLIPGLVVGLVFGLMETGSVLITSRTPKEARSRSQIAALTWLVLGLVLGLAFALVYGVVFVLSRTLAIGLAYGLVVGLFLALRNGGWFVLLQNVAHRRLARAGNLPPSAYDFLEWGIEAQIFRRVGGGVRFRHNLIQQHLASTSAEAGK
jgi:hypothetical protein